MFKKKSKKKNTITKGRNPVKENQAKARQNQIVI
jgi:hypothetical protein